MAFSKFVQTVLNTHYKYDEKVSGRQDGHVIECRQGPTVSSTNVILEIISHECTNEEVVRQSIENLIAVGKLDSTLKTSATDFTFKIVRGSKPVSSKCFDLSLMINLLRRQMSEPGTFDDLPPKEDISDVAQIARIKYYRNECIAHVSDTDMSEHKFEDLWSDLENAINHLGKGANQFATVVKDALSMKLDNFTCETYTKMVNKDMPLNRRKIDKIELPKSFVKIQEVDKADVLGDKGILILVGNKGSGKSTIGMANIKQYCDRNQAYDFIQLSTTTKSNIQNFDRLGFFRPNSSRRNVVVFLDDLFGRIPSKYAFRDHLMLLKWVNNKKDEFDVKILLTVQAETKECFEELFTNDTLLSTTDILNLDSIINRLDHVDILRGIGINEERAAEYKKQMVRTEENQIGCFALFSLFKKNKELWNELFANPKEAFMKYLSSLLQEGDTENNMYYVILIQVCMTGEILARLSHREKKLMGKIVEVLFNSKLDFENDVSVKRIMAR
ncbi:Hypothetical predicted protein [Mytilus galloprovincialis]|uniref:DZIP3-like HEPN domain-containing protein n=1 Tax=Mytilus galloprovincialis TaxID=29158 RepID=A0A8B6BFD5_MYTGA|nr:Hypothetical predicted protein [Mytilus galloprovincialis]